LFGHELVEDLGSWSESRQEVAYGNCEFARSPSEAAFYAIRRVPKIALITQVTRKRQKTSVQIEWRE
jgi:hypothetical protein